MAGIRSRNEFRPAKHSQSSRWRAAAGGYSAAAGGGADRRHSSPDSDKNSGSIVPIHRSKRLAVAMTEVMLAAITVTGTIS
ncbi:unnamed protein product [Heligmosomoides polygyrus]|uniref:Uncharacterized protein n=1 Tax=Heligmosomoides polygyrus TaxID=6339 RepID=A0A183FX84_HELPZ|nr:unnamed protein product [Heligmosomoides polygyrus]